jgi:hypothetical protein
MNIVVIPGTNYNNAPAGFDAAVKYVTNLYDNLFSANVTVYINVDYGIVNSTSQTVPPLGEAYWNLYDLSYSTVRQALINMGAPGSNTLPTTSPFPNATLWLTTAQEKALGFLPADFVPGNGYNFSGVDGDVVIASNQTWSFSPTATPAANQFYIVGALEREFSEVLGRISLDGTNFLNAPGWTLMDLFRYSSPGVRQLSATSSPAYFSTDNGNSVYYYWNTHANGFDLNGELGDWWSSGPNNVNPTGPDAFLDISNPGQINGLSSVDLTLMQTIGWRETPVTPVTPVTNPPPPAGTTADMILRHGADGKYEIYDIGNNAVLAAYQLGQVGTDWAFVTLGGFNGSDTTDMLLRNTSTGGFEVYDISNNNITNAAFLGTVGLNWQVAGFADFNGDGMTDMMLRNSNTGAFEIYNISNNMIINAAASGTVGLNWQVGGFGNFSSVPGETDMIMRNTSTGGLEVYFNNNHSLGAAFMGTVGLEWQIIGVGNFSSIPGESDMIMRNTKTGGLEVYDIANNQITGAFFLGTVGLDWQFAGIAPIHGPGASDLVLRNVNTGAFEVYNIANNQLSGAAALGAVGLDWQTGSIAAVPPSASMGSSDASTSQLVQAMAGFGGGSGAADSLNAAVVGADTSQQTLLTAPHA